MKKTILPLMLFICATITSCSSDDSQETNPAEVVSPKEYNILIGGESDPYNAYPLTVVYYKDDENSSLQTEQVNSETNTDVVQSRNLISYDKLGFKFTVGNNGYVNIYSVIITEIESNEIIFQNYNLDIDTGQTFMYDISDNNYTVQ